MVVYLDNAATTWPKPASVYESMRDCMENFGANPGRAGHSMAVRAEMMINQTRELLAKLFNISDPSRLVLTLNATEAINLGIKGLLKPGDHVITGGMEHNSVIRPLTLLSDQGVEITKIAVSQTDGVSPDDIRNAVKKNTRLIVLSHASNVTGTLNPIGEAGAIARESGVYFMVDCAQTAGMFPIDVQKMNIDLLAFPGHKGLFGPQGTGGLYIGEGINLVPLKEGGTGGNSEAYYQPEQLPSRYESGTPNTPGIAGLSAGMKFIMSEGIEKIRSKEEGLVDQLLSGLQQIPHVILYGPQTHKNRAAVISFNINNADPSDVSAVMDQVFSIASRSGLHCAPDAHRTIGTFRSGTVRVSLSYFNSSDDVGKCLEAVSAISRELTR